MSGDDTFMVVFSVIGVCFLSLACVTWSRRDRWERDRKRWKGPIAFFTGQRELNFQLAMGVLFLGLAIFVA